MEYFTACLGTVRHRVWQPSFVPDNRLFRIQVDVREMDVWIDVGGYLYSRSMYRLREIQMSKYIDR